MALIDARPDLRRQTLFHTGRKGVKTRHDEHGRAYRDDDLDIIRVQRGRRDGGNGDAPEHVSANVFRHAADAAGFYQPGEVAGARGERENVRGALQAFVFESDGCHSDTHWKKRGDSRGETGPH